MNYCAGHNGHKTELQHGSGLTTRRFITVIVVFLVGLVLAMVLLVETVPPSGITLSRMLDIESCIEDYAASHHGLPVSLAELKEQFTLLSGRAPTFENTWESTILDAWGYPIQYSAQGDTVTLRSMGRDNRIGGTGQDADIEETFEIEGLPSQHEDP